MIDTKEEQQYREIKRLAQRLHVPIPEAFWTLEVFDKDGRLIQRHRQRSHSWVRNAYNLLFCEGAAVPSKAADGLDLDDTGGVSRTSDEKAAVVGKGTLGEGCIIGLNWGFYAGATEDTFGILVGSGVVAEDFEDYALGTPIVNGTGAGELSYIETESPSVSTLGTTKKAEWVRYSNNNTVGETSVDVNEVCIVASCSIDSSRECMLCRDVLASTVTVPSTGQLKVTYTIQLTYPS